MEVNLHDIQKTLLIPLWSRAKLSAENHAILIDTKAAEIIRQLDFDFEQINKEVPYFIHLTDN